MCKDMKKIPNSPLNRLPNSPHPLKKVTEASPKPSPKGKDLLSATRH